MILTDEMRAEMRRAAEAGTRGAMVIGGCMFVDVRTSVAVLALLDERDRLERERDAAKSWAKAETERLRQTIDTIYANLEAERAKSAAECERTRVLEEALEPFAKAGELFPPRSHESYNESVYSPAAGPDYNISGDDLRRARRVLARPDTKGEAAE